MYKRQVVVEREGEELEAQVNGDDLGLLVGPRGNTLLALQDLTRVVAQRRLGDHDTRLRVDVAGYRERRRDALTRFALKVAGEVVESGQPRVLEPMASADRKVVHDALSEQTGGCLLYTSDPAAAKRGLNLCVSMLHDKKNK